MVLLLSLYLWFHRTIRVALRGGRDRGRQACLPQISCLSNIGATREYRQCPSRPKSPSGARPRGFHLVTDELLAGAPDLGEVRGRPPHLWIQHTSASLTVNENACPTYARDLESIANEAVPEDASYWTHTLEGPDDMPAHIKASLWGAR